MTQDKVECGFRKWSIGIGESGEVIVEFSYHPNHGTISLHDTSIKEMRDLGEMFLSAARRFEQSC